MTRTISDNLSSVRQRIAKVCASCNRRPEEITIVAVTKTFSAQVVRDVVAAGIDDIGENRVQEAERKFSELGKLARYHLIGHLQSNKVSKAVQLFDVVQSVDSLALAQELDRRAGEHGKLLTCLIEVNSSGEAQKFGLPTNDLVEQLAESMGSLKNLTLAGLMTIGPNTDEELRIRAAFAQTRQLFERCQNRLGAGFDTLSMGMSGDFELAIREGATMLRLGSVLLGSRP